MDPQTVEMTYCEVKPFCRIYERYEATAAGRAANDKETFG